MGADTFYESPWLLPSSVALGALGLAVSYALRSGKRRPYSYPGDAIPKEQQLKADAAFRPGPKMKVAAGWRPRMETQPEGDLLPHQVSGQQVHLRSPLGVSSGRCFSWRSSAAGSQKLGAPQGLRGRTETPATGGRGSRVGWSTAAPRSQCFWRRAGGRAALAARSARMRGRAGERAVRGARVRVGGLAACGARPSWRLASAQRGAFGRSIWDRRSMNTCIGTRSRRFWKERAKRSCCRPFAHY